MFKNCIQNCLHLLKLMHFLDFSYFLRNWWVATLCTAAALSTVFTAVRPSWMCSLAKLRDCCSHRHRLCCHFWTSVVGHVGLHCTSGPVVMRGCVRNFLLAEKFVTDPQKQGFVRPFRCLIVWLYGCILNTVVVVW